MGQRVADINLVSIIMDRGDESNFVTCDIEHREFPNLIGVRKDFAQLRKIQKPTLRMIAYQRTRDDLVSGFERELVQAFPTNDVHYCPATLSQTCSNEKPLLEWSDIRSQITTYP